MIPVILRFPQPSGAAEGEQPRPDRAAGSGEFGDLLAELDALTGRRGQTPADHPSPRGAEEDIPREPKVAKEAATDRTGDDASAEPPADGRPAVLERARALLHLKDRTDIALAKELPAQERPGSAADDAAVLTPSVPAMIAPAPMADAVLPPQEDPKRRGMPEGADPVITRSVPEASASLPRARIVLRETHFAPVLRQEGAPLRATAGNPPETRLADTPSADTRPTDTVMAAAVTGDTVRRGSADQVSADQASAKAAQPHVVAPRPPSSDARPAVAIPGNVPPAETPARPAPAATGRHGTHDAGSRPAPAEQEARSDAVATRQAPEPAARDAAETPARVPSPPLEAAALPPAPTAIVSPPAAAMGPPPSGSPATQVATVIAEAVRIGSAAPNGPETAAARGPVRVLEIQLHPLELGLVTVRLRTGRNGLEIQVNAARAETARLLEQDRALLLASLAGPDDMPPELSIGRHGMPAGLTGYDAPGNLNADPTAPEKPEAEGSDSDTRRRRQPNEHPSDFAADGDPAE